ncbi:hypothetical protein ENASMMO064B1_14280 [Enterobacter asburiae]|uniref:hypothetical protein n=1 Tax=Enterobacter cloacae complex TaxID=354276 RepID=UPI00063A88BF|nr:hypothetical protein [Enterobacter kobei]KLG18635.1 hypothetical protein YA53_14050 [Enterobacter kobei]QFH90752.1 hypothetical protein FR825_13715 [Enterobacter kobei]
MDVKMNDVAVWVLNYKYSAPGLENCVGMHFLAAVENETEEQLQDRMFAEVEASCNEKHGSFILKSGSISPYKMKTS